MYRQKLNHTKVKSSNKNQLSASFPRKGEGERRGRDSVFLKLFSREINMTEKGV